MKSKYLLFSVLGLAAATMVTGCYEMDTLPYAQSLTEDQKTEAKESNSLAAQAGIAGITALFSTYGQTFSSERHNDFGIPAVMLFSDCRAVDMVCEDIDYNWFSGGATMDDCNNSGYYTQLAWANYYKIIFASNAAFKSLDAESTDPTIQFYLGQAYALRANAYFQLAQIYQYTYKGNEDKPCVMLVTEQNEEEVKTQGAGRSTVAEIYAQISSDIDKAIELIEASGLKPSDVLESKPKRFVSLATAYGIRARVNLVKNEWQAAADDAAAAIEAATALDLAPASMTDVAHPTFSSIAETNWMWGVAIATTDRVVTTGICNWPSHMGSLNYGYASVGAWRYINRALFDAIPETDVRKGWFLDADKKSANLSEAQQAYVARKDIPAYVQVKFAPYEGILGTSENANDIPLMRVEEMYYIQAEATAMAGDPGSAAQFLTTFVQTYRDPGFTCGTSADDVQEACFQQRRVELWGEGITTNDLMRLKKPFDRRGGGWASILCYDIEPNDPVLLLVIPNSEVNGNIKFTSADNNNPAPQPTPVKDVDYGDED